MNVYTPKEVAKMLKLSPKNGYITVLRLARAGKLKGSKVGDLWRFTDSDISGLMISQKVR